MPDYSTNVIFKLSVAGDEALNALRTYLSGMKQLLGELNSSAEGARTGINAAANASAAMGTSLSEITKQGAGAAQAINSVAEATRNLNAAQTESKAMSAGTAGETRFSFAGDEQGLQRYWEQQEIQKQHMMNNAEMAAEERLRGAGYSFAGDERGLEKWFEQKEAQRQHEENRLAQVELDRQQGLRNQSLAAQGRCGLARAMFSRPLLVEQRLLLYRCGAFAALPLTYNRSVSRA